LKNEKRKKGHVNGSKEISQLEPKLEKLEKNSRFFKISIDKYNSFV